MRVTTIKIKQQNNKDILFSVNSNWKTRFKDVVERHSQFNEMQKWQ